MKTLFSKPRKRRWSHRHVPMDIEKICAQQFIPFSGNYARSGVFVPPEGPGGFAHYPAGHRKSSKRCVNGSSEELNGSSKSVILYLGQNLLSLSSFSVSRVTGITFCTTCVPTWWVLPPIPLWDLLEKPWENPPFPHRSEIVLGPSLWSLSAQLPPQCLWSDNPLECQHCHNHEQLTTELLYKAFSISNSLFLPWFQHPMSLSNLLI